MKVHVKLINYFKIILNLSITLWERDCHIHREKVEALVLISQKATPKLRSILTVI